VAEPVLLAARDGGVLTLTLNRPRVRNALDLALAEALLAALDAAEADAATGAVILTGAGETFCAGADLKEFAGADADEALKRRRSDSMTALFARPAAMSTPVIAAVEGFAVGGGAALALGCDMVVASRTARFGYPEIRFGMVPVGIVPPLVRRIGAAAAFDLIATGRPVEADEARALGFVQRLVAPEDLAMEAAALADMLVRNGAGAVAVAKRLVRELAAADTETDRQAAVARARAAEADRTRETTS